MIVKEVHYSKKFIKEVKKLSKEVLDLAIKKEEIFRMNPLHPSLRLHELHGKFKGIWSISLTNNYRIIFERMPNGDILFISVGKHDVYKYL
jgi:addiction module RelE/StbE family toxin